jgi:hypothetical protein
MCSEANNNDTGKWGLWSGLRIGKGLWLPRGFASPKAKTIQMSARAAKTRRRYLGTLMDEIGLGWKGSPELLGSLPGR